MAEKIYRMSDQLLAQIEAGKIRTGLVRTKDNLLIPVSQVREGSYKFKEKKYPQLRKRIKELRQDLDGMA